MRYDVIGVGRAVHDYSVLVPTYPKRDTKTEALDRFSGGGSPVPNALCQLAVWGHGVLLSAVVGDDVDGDRFLDDTAAFGVETGSVIRRKGEATPRAFIWVEQGTGYRTIVLDRHIAPLSPDEVPLTDLANCRCLLLDGWEADAAVVAAEAVRGAGGKVMLDAGNVRQRIREQLALADWLVVPEVFGVNFLGGEDPEKAVLELRAFGPELAVITLGDRGCVASWESNTARFPAFERSDIVDTTGAGDVFHAGILHGLLKGWTIPGSIRWASAAAALSVTSLGGRGYLPGEIEMAKFLEESGADKGFQEQ